MHVHRVIGAGSAQGRVGPLAAAQRKFCAFFRQAEAFEQVAHVLAEAVALASGLRDGVHQHSTLGRGLVGCPKRLLGDRVGVEGPQAALELGVGRAQGLGAAVGLVAKAPQDLQGAPDAIDDGPGVGEIGAPAAVLSGKLNVRGDFGLALKLGPMFGGPSAI